MIYFLGNKDLIKIGFATNLQARIEDLEDSLPFQFEIFGVIDGDEIKEQYIHEVFKEHHVSREWFHNCPEILTYVKKHDLGVQVIRRREHKRFFGELKKMRLEAGYTLESFGELLGIGLTSVDKIERRFERGRGNIYTLNKYLSILGYEVIIQKKKA